MPTPVTDPNILAQLNASDAGPKPVTDPALLAQLNGTESTPQQPSLTTIQDVTKSAVGGVEKGAAGLAGLPGSIQDLGDMAGKWLREKVRGPLTPEQTQAIQAQLPGKLPNAQDMQQTMETVTGPVHQPQTTAGKYAQTVGEFLPGAMIGPGGMAAKATRMAVLPGLASEAAGQATEGKTIEPYARLAAGIGASLINPSRVITPNPMTPERQAMVNTLRGEGVDALTAGQRTGSEPLKYFESAAMGAPFSGATATARNELAGEQFTSAALRRAGIDAPRATPEVVDQAFTRIGNDFNRLTANNTMQFDQPLRTELQGIQTNYFNRVNPTQRTPQVENTINELMTYNSPAMTGQQYQTLRSQLAAEARQSGDAHSSRALNQITSALDDAMERSIAARNPADAGAFQEARNQYRNMLVLEKAANTAGEKSAQGFITPAALASATKQVQGLRNYARGQGDFAELARSGVGVMSPLPNSGTEQRGAIMHGIETAGGLLGGLLGYGLGGVESSIGGAVSGPYAARFAGSAAMPFINRALLSNPGQAYLGNQIIPQGANMELQRRLLAAQLLAGPQPSH